MEAYCRAVQEPKSDAIIMEFTKIIQRKNREDLKIVERRLDIVPYKDKGNNSTAIFEIILVVVVCVEIK